MTRFFSSRGRMWLALLCLIGLSLPAMLPAVEKRVEPVKPVITPSPETTHITSPLDSEGYVDYLAALNERLGAGVSSGENAAIPLLEAIGVAERNLEVTNLLRAALGMPAWTSGSMQMFSIGDLVKERTGQFSDNGVVTDSAGLQAESQRILDQNAKAAERPWKEADFPEMAEVLKRNAASLQRVTDGVKRPKYYRPLVKRSANETMVAILLPDIQVSREFARQLSMRAMLHLGHGRVKESKEDLLTMHRLGAHISRGATLIEGLVGVAIDSMAAAGDNRWAQHPKVTAADIAAYRAQIVALPAVSNFGPQIDVSERFMGLDVTQAVARGRLTATSVLDENQGILAGEESSMPKLGAQRLMESFIGLSVDWAVAMQTLNKQYDDLAAFAKIPNPQARDKALADLNATMVARRAELGSVKSVVASVLGGNKGRGKNMGNTFANLLVPAVAQVFEAENRVRMRREVTIAGFAILEYRAANGACPASLQDLVPEYLTAVPADVYTGEALKYATDGVNFKVYAIGKNRTDDNGRTFTANQPWDDIGFHIPALQP